MNLGWVFFLLAQCGGAEPAAVPEVKPEVEDHCTAQDWQIAYSRAIAIAEGAFDGISMFPLRVASEIVTDSTRLAFYACTITACKDNRSLTNITFLSPSLHQTKVNVSSKEGKCIIHSYTLETETGSAQSVTFTANSNSSSPMDDEFEAKGTGTHTFWWKGYVDPLE